LTFEDYFKLSPSWGLDLLLVNPLHHANSSALSDLGMRRPGAIIHLVQRYETKFWRVLSEVAEQKRDLLVTSLVARHIDFLRNLWESSRLPVEKKRLEAALRKTDILMGSAPVGPKTVAFLKDICGYFPHIRFGSTETCLQVMAIPTTLKEDEKNAAFKAGYDHRFHGEKTEGYYIGREHIPFTRVKMVKAIDPQKKGYMVPCGLGEPGYFITQGANIMNGYVGDREATEAVFREGWYTGLRDIGFVLKGKDDLLDYYWRARDSALLIRGGANYAYEQVAAALSRILAEDLTLPADQFKLAVVGLRMDSEHDDSCCVTIELGEEGKHMEEVLRKIFIDTATKKLPKGYHPDRVRFAKIPVNFKGVVLYEQLKQEYEKNTISQKVYLKNDPCDDGL
jgi:acyl-CoA synthetase (AMP-forming)/AMP-acid ligase II